MAIKKKVLKSKPFCKCTFSLPKAAAPEAKLVTLVGDFNDWDEQSIPMKKLKSGDFKVDVNLPINAQYQFKYLVDSKTWVNDWDADDYVSANGLDTENSLVSV